MGATLLQVMGKAARQLDMGAAYASSALFVLIAFIHRHASRVLPQLSRFTEVVLRCLEPSDPSLRRQSLLAVTSALHELVQTFPMVAFHQPSQKFAVGTGDGLVVVYDLRTATKWRILEGHTSAVAALPSLEMEANWHPIARMTVACECGNVVLLASWEVCSGRVASALNIKVCLPLQRKQRPLVHRSRRLEY